MEPSSDLLTMKLSRRSILRISGIAGVAALASGLLAACGDDDDDDDEDPGVPEVEEDPEDEDEEEDVPAEPDDEDDRFGGTLNVALNAEPPTLDSMWTTAIITQIPALHVFENLLTYDSEWNVQPMLLENYEISDDGLHYTFQLRQGVNFHNGDVLEASDVIASIERWFDISAFGQQAAEATEDVTAVDDHTVELQLHTPFAPLLNYISSPFGQGLIIIPEEVADAVGSERMTDEHYIGTAPFEFVEHIPDRHVLVRRFENYSSRDEEPSFYAGRRTAYADEVRFLPMADVAARIASVETGEIHWAEEVSRDDFPRLDADPDVEAIILSPLRWKGAIFNKQRGPFTDVRLRRAALLALDKDEIMAASFGDDSFWRLDHSLMPLETPWYSEVGQEDYNQMDLDQARQLVEESGYDGEPIRWMSPSDRDDYFSVAVVAVPMLQEIGLNVEVRAVDWGTLVDLRTDSEEWEIFNTGFGFGPEPITVAFIPASWPGWWESDVKEEALRALMEETDFDRRKELWDDFQRIYYDEVPVIKVGDFFGLTIKRREVRGENTPIAQEPIFWNTWLEN